MKSASNDFRTCEATVETIELTGRPVLPASVIFSIILMGLCIVFGGTLMM